MLLLLIILAPFAASLLTYLTGKKPGWVSIFVAGLSLAGAIGLLFTINADTTTLSYAGLPGRPFLLYANAAASTLSLVVAITAFSIFIYAPQYMHDEKGKRWFWAGMSLFLSGMQLLVFAGDWVLFITAWEIMGISSYLLIATWHEKPEAQQGAMKAFMLTRFTDMGLYLGIFVIAISTNSLQIAHTTATAIGTTGGVFLLIAVMGKSAQVPFQSWLSGAMAGPTPVSALLHSATMVAAGALLLFRVYPLLNNEVLFITGIVGGITILLTGITAIASRDVKQMLAASTSSQLGFMLLAIGAGSPGAAFAHWVAHAFMKSSLFLGAGIFQHEFDSTAFSDTSSAGKKLKASFTGFAIAAVGLSGIPPLIGYWSKDGILAAGNQSPHSTLFFLIAVVGALFTALYMGKSVSRLWHSKADNKPIAEPKQMLSGLFVLVVLVVAGGIFLQHLVTFSGYEIPSDTLSKIAGIAAAIVGLVAGWYLKESLFDGKVWNTIRDNYSIAGGYATLVAAPVLKLAGICYQFDRTLLSFVEKTGKTVLNFSHLAQSIDDTVDWMTNLIGKAGLQLSNGSKAFEENGVETSVYAIASSVKQSGKWGKKLQSGLVHKELVITVAGLLVLIFVLIAMISYE